MLTTDLVLECPRCGGEHAAGTNLHKFTKPSGPWTHYFLCPVLTEPALVKFIGEHQIVEADYTPTPEKGAE